MELIMANTDDSVDDLQNLDITVQSEVWYGPFQAQKEGLFLES